MFITAYPYLIGKPTLSTRYNQTSTDFFFTCSYNVTEREGVQYTIHWLHGNDTVSQVTVTETGSEELNVLDIEEFAYGSKVSLMAYLIH